MTTTKEIASKLSVALVAIAMVFSAFASTASAQTTEELQAMINDLLAQVAALQATTSGTAVGGTCTSIMAPLTIGSRGGDVMALQNYLMTAGFSIPAGPTDYFGGQTQAALAQWQAANGVAPAVGYYGPITKAAIDAKCVVTEDEDMDDEDMDDEDMDSDVELQGEASLDTFELDDGESSVEEGDEEMSIGEITVEFTDGDAQISRMDITLDSTSTEDPWDVFETISLWVDGDMIAEMDASDEDDYLDEDAGELRFSNLDLVAMEDEQLDIIVAATIMNNVDADAFDSWNLTVTSMRFFDADGVATTDDSFDGIGSDVSSFDVEEAGMDEELKISLASENPESTDIIVDTDTDTNDVTIMVADLEAEDNDIELNRVVVHVETDGETTTNVIDEIRVVIDGEEFDAESIGGTPGATSTITSSRSVLDDADGQGVWYVFDIDGDVTIDEGDEIQMEVVVDFNDTDDGARYSNGQMITVSVSSVERDLWEAEGADDLDTNQFSGTAIGDDHTLVSEGILVPVDGFSSEVRTLGQDDNIGEFTLEFEVTAVEGDFYIANNAGLASTSPTTGVVFTVAGGAAVVTSSLDSSADEDTADVFTVREGETETFSLVVTVDPAAAGTFRVGLQGIHFTENANGTDDANPIYEVTPVTDFRTAQKAINA